LVGLVGWRGMVGSVLMDRMVQEGDFDLIEPLFFSTSNAGGAAPAQAKNETRLQDANDIAALSRCEIVITCQGGDYTKEVYPKLRAAGWKGHWIDAASTLRMADHAVIILDPVNRSVIDQALAKGGRDWIGGNCTVSLMLMAMGGLFQHKLVEWVSAMTYQAASGAGAQNMRELLQQMGALHDAVKGELADPASAILDIDRKVSATMRSSAFPTQNFRNTFGGQFDPLDRRAGRARSEQRGVEGRFRVQQDPGQPRLPQRWFDPDRWPVRAHRRHALPQPGLDHQAQEGCAHGRGDRDHRPGQ